ncbi:hypothetical protein NM208_g13391 [Fusarium decemcellulare]|uniref:Uncharacterized protein n=1 Tax=Fusarium decemcellulare TaxID=57161 RepID=A0ACC1RK01_9HYPO|nr:hypothetical protein NM208_g13391 [Fusarium decemcellulare]
MTTSVPGNSWLCWDLASPIRPPRLPANVLLLSDLPRRRRCMPVVPLATIINRTERHDPSPAATLCDMTTLSTHTSTNYQTSRHDHKLPVAAQHSIASAAQRTGDAAT